MIDGAGFAPDCTVDVTVTRPSGGYNSTTVSTDADGAFTFSYDPGAQSGDFSASFSGENGQQLMGVTFTNGPVVSLDRGDVPDGGSVQVSGTAFTPSTQVTVRITRPDGSIVRADGTPGSDTVSVDLWGNFTYVYVVREGTLDDYPVDVLDQAGNVLAHTSFTDSGAFVKNIGNASGTNISTLSIPATGGVVAGDSIIVAFQIAGSTAGTPAASCSDGKNTYTFDVTLNNGTNPSLWICSAHNVTALLGTDNIVVRFPATSGRAIASAHEFSGLLTSGNPLDRTKTGSGNTNAPTTGFTAAPTSQADELLFGAIAFSGTSAGTFTAPGTGACTSNTPAAQGTYTTISNVPGNAVRGLAAEYRIATQVAQYAACGTLSTANQWIAGIATYKIAAGDSIPPTVSSINRADANPTNAASVSWTVTFSEPVTGVDATDFALVGTGTSGASITGVTGSGPYVVTANTGVDGTLGLNLVDNDSIVDGAGNKLGGTGAGNGNFIGQVYTVDKSAPTVSSIVRANANPTNASSVDFTVTFSESVSGVNAGDFSVITGLGGTPAVTAVTPAGPTNVYTVSDLDRRFRPLKIRRRTPRHSSTTGFRSSIAPATSSAEPGPATATSRPARPTRSTASRRGQLVVRADRQTNASRHSPASLPSPLHRVSGSLASMPGCLGAAFTPSPANASMRSDNGPGVRPLPASK